MDICAAFRLATFLVACQDFFLGTIGVLSISVQWSASGTVLPIFQGKLFSDPRKRAHDLDLPFMDDIYMSQYLLLGLVLAAGFMTIFSVILWLGAYKKSLFLLEIWKLFNMITLFILAIGMIFMAFSDNGIPYAILGCLPLAFRLTEVWIVLASQETIRLKQQRENYNMRRKKFKSLNPCQQWEWKSMEVMKPCT